ncbi:sugar phosphate isomerase/epimerase family protein [Sediminicoccus sp. KRV36]|uniref:sugar phosphate isomerase/epimerase family protein n=1 Tax=Sediminicoccus sp. KRV36 TaxID=3133721 RepID=UPI0020102726|nr:sugar phosphate isomerase/epimerase family protein [Sediminicoccus rosea]UPY36260.1 sugar phosphate isomerase/epimerase [Sediminicoccus rosea]
MRFALCNEVLRHLPFAEQAQLSAALGYDGLEVAPFTLDAEAPHKLSAARRAELRRMAGDAGQPITGLHWLLVAPAGLSITEAAKHAGTVAVMRALVDLAVDLGATYLVHGSPAQRHVAEPGDAARAEAALAAVAAHAAQAGVTYVLEPLDPGQTNWASSLAEALAIVARIGSPALRTMLDVCATGNGESEPAETLLRAHIPGGQIAHVHLNDRNKRGPGQGQDQFAPVLRALDETGYSGICGVEPFDYHPDPMACAARAIGYLRGIEEGHAP